MKPRFQKGNQRSPKSAHLPPDSPNGTAENKQPTLHSTTSTLTSSDLVSSLESLPRHLILQIIDEDPENALAMRATSRFIKSCVDEYAMMGPSLQLVEELIISGPIKDSQKICLSLIVPRHNSFHLELRLIRHPCYKKVRLMRKFMWNGNRDNNLFQVNIQIGFEGAFEYFSQSIGNNIGKVVIERFEGQLFPKLFNGKEFHHLDVSHTIFTQTEADKLNNTIRDHSVEQLTLTVGKVVMSDPVRIVLQLSNLLSSLRIYQTDNVEINSDSAYFFGVVEGDWPRIIADMFTRKLDKLCIENYWFPEYLSTMCADKLKEALPLLGKQLWFAASYGGYEGAKRKHKDYLVEGKVRFSKRQSISAPIRECQAQIKKT
ncbi:hypothetical protein PRIPAC_79164 [Pristionchus pacificus]|uniref:Uncharacterized protein n=1 Tax=Pristionchus pacificus TaxID=54126 RepID=A0A2A6BWW3_PRIPA|nr:hypothetical protein PRIPAC_79164 [Pristionchus pacificus]|eukprot:PDM70347.1 hypothetical protein PRIPAC_46593 [Pristionchus pacificus]